MSDTGEGSGWVVEPPNAESAQIRLEFSDDTELTPDLRQALEDLARAMEGIPPGAEQEEVEAYRICHTKTVCSPLTTGPCVAKTIVDCTIVSCPRAFAEL